MSSTHVLPRYGIQVKLVLLACRSCLYAREDIPPSVTQPVVTIRVKSTANASVPEITEQKKPRYTCMSFFIIL